LKLLAAPVNELDNPRLVRGGCDEQTCRASGKECPVMPKQILIADDDEDSRRVIRWLIESRTAWEVCGEAVNGFDAIEKARTLSPDLILLDYSMPTMNGIETGAALKAMLPRVPVILFTGTDARAIESAAISVGILAVVPKADIGRLARHLENLVDC
jgi:CheY-like chemotaxis protein